jgi:two-component system, NtrC family, sensor kinase
MRWFGEKEIIVKLFSKLCSHENDAMLLIDETGYILAGNGAYSQEKGHPLPPEAYLSDFFPDDFSKNIAALQQNASETDEYTYKIPRKESFPYSGSLQLIDESAGLWLLRLKKTEFISRDNAFLKSLLETITHPVFFKDKEFRYQGCNRTFAQMLIGRDEPELLYNKTVLELQDYIPESMAKRYYEADLKLWNDGGQQHYEGQVRCHDGLTRDFIFSKSVYYDSKGELAGIVGIMTDITERKKSERQREKEKAWLQAIIDSLDIAVFIIDKSSHKILDSNQKGGSLLEMDRKTLLGADAEKLLFSHPGSKPDLDNPEKERHRECFLKIADGSDIPVMRSIAEIKILESAHLVCSIADQRQRKELEHQLLHARKLESIGELAAGVAHEINTPIQYISDNLHFVKDNFLQIAENMKIMHRKMMAYPEMQAFFSDCLQRYEEMDLEYILEELPLALSQSLQGIEQVATIVKAMKAFGRPGVTDKVHININSSIQNAITISRNEWKYATEIISHLHSELPMIKARPNEFNQVILHLISNAVLAIKDKRGDKPLEKGKIEIITGCNQQEISIEIRDDGIGIPPENLPKIFDLFFTTRDVGKGSGHGLYLAHNVIVNKLKGKITVTENPGGGTIFTLIIPLQTETKDSL